MKGVLDKFLYFISFDTQSDENSTAYPSTDKQLVLAKELVKEGKRIGFDFMDMDRYGVVYGILNATDASLPSYGFCSHMDTAPDFCGANVRPWILEKYDGSMIRYPSGQTMSKEDYPVLDLCLGEDLILTDGSTLLGGDDKAGISIILEMVEEVIQEKIPHGKIVVAFTPDEEIGKGVDHLDLSTFDVDHAYTVDGSRIDAIDYENFNAAMATVTIQGTNIHPGEAKDKMVNACLLASEWIQKMPKRKTPAHTENRQGFFHLSNMKGDCDKARLIYLIRHHDQERFEQMKKDLQHLCNQMNAKYPDRFHVEIRDQYANMKRFIMDFSTIDLAKKAIRQCGLKPVSIPTRGGTDGAMLTEKGCVCPNLGTGSYNHHGAFEFVSVQQMEKMVEILKCLIKLP